MIEIGYSLTRGSSKNFGIEYKVQYANGADEQKDKSRMDGIFIEIAKKRCADLGWDYSELTNYKREYK